ncbi:MAG: M3 family oligoendopeptidase [Planctomycetota bacterium]
MTTYVHCPDRPQTLEPAWIEARYRGLLERAAEADRSPTPDGWLALYEDWNALKSYLGSEGSRRRHAYSRAMDDPAKEEAERVYREELNPKAEDGESALVAALLQSPHKEAIGARYGPSSCACSRCSRSPRPAQRRVPGRSREPGHRIRQARGPGRGRGPGRDPDPGSRPGQAHLFGPGPAPAAFEAYYGWFVDNRELLADVYHRQVQVRDRMGKTLGHPTFVPLGYAGMGRTDYGPEEAARFRAAVQAHASPLFRALCEEQAQALGTPTLRPWDREYHPGRTLPVDVAEPVEEQLDKAGRVFERLSPKLAAHFSRMREQGLIDLENRKAKRAGAYCTSFPDENKVAIFCNSVGSEGDVGTLTHEMGHAFQGWESQWIDAVDLRWPTSDACEVHSMGMEYLSLPYLDEFFTPEQQARFTHSRWKRGVELLCYVSVVDAFQHWVYEHPQATPDERDQTWVRLQDTFLPGIDWSGEAERYRASRWYAQLHIFRYPFYYIDYAIAETGAMQLGMLDTQDHEGCLATYLELCRLGGTGSVLQLFQGAGLRSPFDPDGMRDLMAHAADVLGLPTA